MRNFFAREVTSLASKAEEVFLVYGDIGNRLFDDFKKVAPERFVNAGIAEASMITMTAGLAKSGFVPFVYTINPFIYLKALEQIKLDICYPQLPVIMVGTGGGLAYSELGTTHHSLEDLGVLRNIPNLEIYGPADEFELISAVHSAFDRRRPAYIRIGKKESKKIHFEKSILGKLDGEFISAREMVTSSLAIVTFGTIATEVLEAHTLLATRTNLDLWTAPQLKPLSSKFLRAFLSKYKKVFIVEEHRNSGGLFSILAEALAASGPDLKTQLFPINAADQFHTGLGDLDSARKVLGLDAQSIVDRILSEI